MHPYSCSIFCHSRIFVCLARGVEHAALAQCRGERQPSVRRLARTSLMAAVDTRHYRRTKPKNDKESFQNGLKNKYNALYFPLNICCWRQVMSGCVRAALLFGAVLCVCRVVGFHGPLSVFVVGSMNRSGCATATACHTALPVLPTPSLLPCPLLAPLPRTQKRYIIQINDYVTCYVPHYSGILSSTYFHFPGNFCTTSVLVWNGIFRGLMGRRQ